MFKKVIEYLSKVIYFVFYVWLRNQLKLLRKVVLVSGIMMLLLFCLTWYIPLLLICVILMMIYFVLRRV